MNEKYNEMLESFRYIRAVISHMGDQQTANMAHQLDDELCELIDQVSIFERVDRLRRKGIIIEVIPHNQIQNGYKTSVENGDFPLITFTGTAYDEHFYDTIYAVSCDLFEDALFEVVSFVEKNMDDAMNKVQTAKENEVQEK